MPIYPEGVSKKWYKYESDDGNTYRVKLSSDLADSALFEEIAPGNLGAYAVKPRRMEMRGVYLKKIDVEGELDRRNFLPLPTPNHSAFLSGGTIDFETRPQMTVTSRRGERTTR